MPQLNEEIVVLRTLEGTAVDGNNLERVWEDRMKAWGSKYHVLAVSLIMKFDSERGNEQYVILSTSNGTAKNDKQLRKDWNRLLKSKKSVYEVLAVEITKKGRAVR